MTQFARPSSDLFNAATPTPSSPSTLFDKVNETPFSDAEYFSYPADAAAHAQLKFGATITNPADTGHIIRIRCSSNLGDALAGIAVTLQQGSTIISATTIGSSLGGFTTVEWALSEAEAAAITDYSDLNLTFSSFTISPSSDVYNISGVELQTGDPLTPGTWTLNDSGPVDLAMTFAASATAWLNQDWLAPLGYQMAAQGAAGLPIQGLFVDLDDVALTDEEEGWLGFTFDVAATTPDYIVQLFTEEDLLDEEADAFIQQLIDQVDLVTGVVVDEADDALDEDSLVFSVIDEVSIVTATVVDEDEDTADDDSLVFALIEETVVADTGIIAGSFDDVIAEDVADDEAVVAFLDDAAIDVITGSFDEPEVEDGLDDEAVVAFIGDAPIDVIAGSFEEADEVIDEILDQVVFVNDFIEELLVMAATVAVDDPDEDYEERDGSEPMPVAAFTPTTSTLRVRTLMGVGQ